MEIASPILSLAFLFRFVRSFQGMLHPSLCSFQLMRRLSLIYLTFSLMSNFSSLFRIISLLYVLIMTHSHCTMGQNHFETSKIHFSTREWAKWASVRTSQRSGGCERSEQSTASERVSSASERANGRASGPVLQSVFLAVFDHSAHLS